MSEVLNPRASALLGQGWRANRRPLRLALARYFRARLEPGRVAEAVAYTESEAYTVVAGWLLRGTVAEADLHSAGFWVRTAREVAPRFFASLALVVDGSPLRALGAIADKLPAAESSPAAEADPVAILAALCSAYAPDAPEWVADTLAAVLLMPEACHRDRAAVLGVPLDTFRTRWRRIRAAIVGD